MAGTGSRNGGKRRATRAAPRRVRRRPPPKAKYPTRKTTPAKAAATSPARRPTTKASPPRPKATTAGNPRRRPAPRKRLTAAQKRAAARRARLFGFAKGVGVASLAVIVIGGAIVFYYARDLPPTSRLGTPSSQPRVIVVDRAGATLGIHGRDQGPPIDLADLPPHVVQAFLATEDRNFYGHVGVNPVAILRATLVNARAGGVAQGGSTITQQLVKNALLTPEQSLKRKAQEALLAVRIERALSKDEILAAYLNTVYFGNGAYGLEAASRRYFGHQPSALSVGEAAMLAGLLKAPSRLAPTNAPDAARARASVVLRAMVNAGYLTATQADAVIADGIASVQDAPSSGSYAADAALAELRERVGTPSVEVTVVTTVDAALTAQVTRALDTEMTAEPLTADAEGAVILMEEDGRVRALVGGRDYAASPYDRTRLARRAPGSTFKPFVFLAAVEAGWRPESLVDDSPVEIEGYAPGNYKDRYYGEVSLTEALRRSLNAPAIRLQEAAGREAVVNLARRVGLGAEDVGPALALGVTEQTPLAVANAYAALSSGRRASPYLISEVRTAQGDVLYRARTAPGPQVVAEADRVALDHMLRAVVREGSGVHARVPGHAAAGKTGTGQDSRDAWFAGYASGLVGVVWMGHDDFAPMGDDEGALSGSGAPARVWSAAMTAGLEGRPPRAPIPYVPAPKEEGLLDHLAGLLGWGGKEEPETDDIADLLGAM